MSVKLKLKPDTDEIIRKKIYPVFPLINYHKGKGVMWQNQSNWLWDAEALNSERGKVYRYPDKEGEDGRIIKGKVVPATGYGVVAGAHSGLLILDLDRNHADGVDGVAKYMDILRDLNLSEAEKERATGTYKVRTPKGGMHLYFKYKAGLTSGPVTGYGIDIISDGKLAVAPGSWVDAKLKEREQNPSIPPEIKPYMQGLDAPIYEIPDKLFSSLVELRSVGEKGKKKSTSTKPKNEAIGADKKKYKAKRKYYTDVVEGGRNDALTSYIGKLITQPMFRDKQTVLEHSLMYNSAYMKPPLSDEEVEDIVDSVLSYVKPPYCKDNGKIVVGALVKHVLKTKHVFTRGNMLYMYNDETGIYDYLDPRNQQQLFYSYVCVDEDYTYTKAEQFSKTICVMAENYKELFSYENRYINCLNGIIDTSTDELIPYTPKIKLDAGFNGNYYDEEKWNLDFKNSNFKKFLESILDAETILTLQEAWGVMLCPNSNKIQQVFIYKGEGANGKSSLFDIQSALIRNKDKSICGIGLDGFGEEFALSMAEGRRLNIVRDDNPTGKPHGAFKSAVCGEEVTVNRKNKDHVILKFNIAWYYGVNRLPTPTDKSYGFFRRSTLIPFNVRFGTAEQVSTGFADKIAIPGVANTIITEELDIVFMWAYQGLKRLIRNSWVITISEASRALKEEYLIESDSAYAFAEEHIVRTQGYNTSSLGLYQRYTDWCYRESLTPMNSTQFKRQLVSHGYRYNKGTAHDTKKEGVKIYNDIKYVEYKTPKN